MDKRTPDSFDGTELGSLLADAPDVVIVGMQSEYCVRETSLAALKRGLGVVLVRGAHATYGGGKHTAAEIAAATEAELAPRRIAVNVVAPGPVATDFSGGIVRDNPALNKMIAENTALGRAGVPEDIGPMIASLLSEKNRWVNAQRIEVAGGGGNLGARRGDFKNRPHTRPPKCHIDAQTTPF